MINTDSRKLVFDILQMFRVHNLSYADARSVLSHAQDIVDRVLSEETVHLPLADIKEGFNLDHLTLSSKAIVRDISQSH